MFTAVLFKELNFRKYLECLTIRGWLQQLWHIYTDKCSHYELLQLNVWHH